MAKIPENPNTTKHLLDSTMPESKGDGPRLYLGMSSIGDPCARKLWYSFRWASSGSHTPRTLRIFERGDLEEARVITALKRIGIECFRRDEYGEKVEITGAVGEEQEEIIGFAGHAKGHPDGRCLGVVESPKTEHLLEIKTMNDAGFKKLVKEGLKKSKPVYYSQVQVYMARLKLKRTLHITVNKNDEEYYIERVKFDEDHAKDMERREQDIIMSDIPPIKEFPKVWYACKMCNHYNVCQEQAPPNVNCRSCANVEMEIDGVWKCAINSEQLNKAKQLAGCSSYRRAW
jgi:hypothetical protein